MNLPALARQAIETFLTTGQNFTLDSVPPEVNYRAGVFVTLERSDGSLRGCIGTIEPTTANVATEAAANAVSAATRDNRFTPVQAAELPDLHISVDVLSPLTPEPNPLTVNPVQYGVVVASDDGRQGVLLPDLPGVETAEDQIAITREKAGIAPDEAIQVWKFTAQRFQE